MHKLTVKSFDEIKEYKIDSARIITSLYKAFVKEGQIHSPSAALFVAKNSTNAYRFVLFNSLVECDKLGNITIYTDRKFEDLVVSHEHVSHSNEYQINKLQLKALEDKIKIGATIEEIWMYSEIKNKVEIGKIIKKNKFYKQLGGDE